MVSKASELLPEPLGPVKTVKRSRGTSTSMFCRLCVRAPRTRIHGSNGESMQCSIQDARRNGQSTLFGMQLAHSNLVSYKWIGESDRVREFLIREGTFLGERKMKRRFLLSAVLGLSAAMFLANVSQAQSYFYGYYYPEEGRFASTKLNHGMYTYSTVTPFWNALNDP